MAATKPSPGFIRSEVSVFLGEELRKQRSLGGRRIFVHGWGDDNNLIVTVQGDSVSAEPSTTVSVTLVVEEVSGD